MRLGGRGLRSFGLERHPRLLVEYLAAYRVGRLAPEHLVRVHLVRQHLALSRGMLDRLCSGQASTESRW